MHLTRDDLIEIRTLLSIGWKPAKILEFRVANIYRGARPWLKGAIYRAVKKIKRQNGSVERPYGSGRPKKARTEENEDRVEELLSPKKKPGTHLSQRKVARVVDSKMAFWIPLVAMTAFWLLIGVGGPLLIPSGPNRDFIRTMIVLTAVCCYMFWIIVYLHQLNPMIGPQIPVKTILWIHEQWGDTSGKNL